MVVSIVEKYNKLSKDLHYGYGIDPYCYDQPRHHSMAYACVCIANCNLYNLTHDANYLRDAIECADMLNNLKLESETGYSWGLGFGWREQPPEHSYTITTIFCADAFLSLYTITKNTKYLDVLNKISEWILQKNMWHCLSGDSACIYYSPALKICVLNVASKTASFLFRISTISEYKNKEASDMAKKAFNFVMNSQKKGGFWNYSLQSDIIDNLHTAFILEGLLDYYNISGGNKLRKTIKDGLSFYIRNFFSNGYGIEKIEPRDPSLELVKFLIKKKKQFLLPSVLFSSDKRVVFLRYKKEARLWCYGAAFTVLSKANMLGFNNVQRSIENIYRYVINNLLDKNGNSRFLYKSGDRSFFVRHEAFMYLGLASLESILD